MNIYYFFKLLELSSVSQFIKQTSWLFPIIESIHLVAFAILGGSTLIIDLTLLGLGPIKQLSSIIEDNIRPCIMLSVSILIFSGTLLFLSEATKLYTSTLFWLKMSSLIVALLFTLFIRNPTAQKNDQTKKLKNKLIALISLFLWLSIAILGRGIGFS